MATIPVLAAHGSANPARRAGVPTDIRSIMAPVRVGRDRPPDARPPAATIALASLALVGCGGGAFTSGSTDPGGPGSAPAPSVAAGFRLGHVEVDSAAAAPTSPATYQAYFLDVTDPACALRIVGSCSVVRCAIAPDGRRPECGWMSAGPIRLSWGRGGNTAVDLPGVQNTYEYQGATLGPFQPGDVLTFTAAGGEVPAFGASVIFPEPIEDASAGAIDPNSDYGVTWTGARSSRVRVAIQQSDPDREVQVLCTFESAAEAGTVPAAALADLSATTEGGADARLGIAAVGEAQLRAGDYPVTVFAAQQTDLRTVPVQ